MKIIQNLPQSRWKEYRDLRFKSLTDSATAFTEDAESAGKKPKEYWLSTINNRVFAEEAGKLIGMIGYFREERPKTRHIVNVVNTFVLPEYRGKKVGKKLLKEVIIICKRTPQVKKVQLGVIETQKPAINLYKSLGFKRVGTRRYAVKVGKKYFTEYLMELYL